MEDYLQLFITGGTFDKEYNFINGKLYFKETHLHDMLERGRCMVPTDIKTLMMKDSLDMSDLDRQVILEACRQTPYRDIVITHGTDTMVETAKMLASQAGIENKTIVLMGAMVPYAFGSSSDGFFNLGSAFAFAQMLQPGVYVVMNGRYYTWDNVKKNRQTGFFEPL